MLDYICTSHLVVGWQVATPSKASFHFLLLPLARSQTAEKAPASTGELAMLLGGDNMLF